MPDGNPSPFAPARAGIRMLGAVILTALVIAPLRTLFFLDETEPFRRRWRRRR